MALESNSPVSPMEKVVVFCWNAVKISHHLLVNIITKKIPFDHVFMMPNIWIRIKMCIQHVSKNLGPWHHGDEISSYLTRLLLYPRVSVSTALVAVSKIDSSIE